MDAGLISIPYEKVVLENGLTVLIHEDHKAPIVAVNIWYHVGSKNEKPGKTGFAHLFEHLMFGGSENLAGSYIEYLERAGATDLNGTTNEDRTNYFETVPAPAIDFALFAESDRMGHFYNTISQDVLNLQRGVVQNEKKQNENQPYAVAEELVVKATYPAGHPYAHTVIGSMEDLDTATLEDVRQWFKGYYTPSNATLVICGDISVKEAQEKAKRFFGDIPPGPPVTHQQAWVARIPDARREVAEDRVPHARLYRMWNVPEYGAAEATYLNLAANLLSTGKSSRLYKRLVYDDQIATSVQAYLDTREIGSQFGVEVTAQPGQALGAVEQAVNEELERFLASGPTEAELERVKTQQFSGFVRGVERIGGFGGKSDILARNETFLGRPDAYREMIERIGSASTDQVRDAARAWLVNGTYTLEVVPFPAYKVQVQGVDRTTLPVVGLAQDLHFPALRHDTLSNGLKLVLAERSDVPLVNLWLAVDAGFSADQLSLPGTARLAATLMTHGTATRNALEISDELQLLGAQLSASSNLDLSLVFLSALKSKLDASLNLFADVVLNPSFPEADFRRIQQLQLAAIEQEKAQPYGMALRVFPPILYGSEHAYGTAFTGSGTVKSVTALKRGDVEEFHRRWFRPNNTTLVIAGDTTLEEIKPKLEALFGHWKREAVPAKYVPVAPLPQKPAVYLLDKPGALQSVILTGTLAPAPDASEEPVLEALNNVFGGSFGARLNMNLREEKHWTYGAGSLVVGARAQRPFLTHTSVQTDKTKEAMAEIRREMEDLMGPRPASAAEVEKVKTQTILELPGSMETLNALGGMIIDLLQYRLPDNYYQTYVGQVKAIGAAEVNRAAPKLLDSTKTVWVVVGDRSKIEAEIRALDFGEIRFVDADGRPSKG
jgi:zinc protease